MPSQNLATVTAQQVETTASAAQLTAREQIAELFRSSPLPPDELLFNLGLYTRSSLLVKQLVLHELYARFSPLPGILCEFGTWWGQNLVLLENLRAIHEPFNKQRRIVGFDTFAGYTPPSEVDVRSQVWGEHAYSTGPGYRAHLEALLRAHEAANVLGHVTGCHVLVEGDITTTAPAWFAARPEVIVAFAYFDIALYEPTRAAMLAIKPHLVPGSILLLDELTWTEAPGEALAFREVFGDTRYRLEKVERYPSKAIVVIG